MTCGKSRMYDRTLSLLLLVAATQIRVSSATCASTLASCKSICDSTLVTCANLSGSGSTSTCSSFHRDCVDECDSDAANCQDDDTDTVDNNDGTDGVDSNTPKSSVCVVAEEGYMVSERAFNAWCECTDGNPRIEDEDEKVTCRDRCHRCRNDICALSWSTFDYDIDEVLYGTWKSYQFDRDKVDVDADTVVSIYFYAGTENCIVNINRETCNSCQVITDCNNGDVDSGIGFAIMADCSNFVGYGSTINTCTGTDLDFPFPFFQGQIASRVGECENIGPSQAPTPSSSSHHRRGGLGVGDGCGTIWQLFSSFIGGIISYMHLF